MRKTMREYIVRETDCGLATKQEIVGELVRCKDCKHAQDGGPGFVWCPQIVGSLAKESDYCAWGERKDDAVDH